MNNFLNFPYFCTKSVSHRHFISRIFANLVSDSFAWEHREVAAFVEWLASVGFSTITSGCSTIFSSFTIPNSCTNLPNAHFTNHSLRCFFIASCLNFRWNEQKRSNFLLIQKIWNIFDSTASLSEYNCYNYFRVLDCTVENNNWDVKAIKEVTKNLMH